MLSLRSSKLFKFSYTSRHSQVEAHPASLENWIAFHREKTHLK